MHPVQLESNISELVCSKCDYTIPLPQHCHKPMTFVDGKLVCWKGEHAPCCNSSSILDIPEHHEMKMILKK